MKNRTLSILLLLGSAAACFGQMTTDQRVADFRFLAGLYAKHYAPYEWKKTLFGFDALQIGPWLERVKAAQDDLDYYEICVEYVASLNDTHDAYSLPSNFVASLGFTVDIYDGKVLIDTITRSILPASAYPFGIGDELVSMDGKPVGDLLTEFAKYARQGNPRSTLRQTASRLVTRSQIRMPHAASLGESAAVVIRRMNGAEESYTIPWQKTGEPVHVGPVPSPRRASMPTAEDPEAPVPDYMQALLEMQYSGVNEDYGVLNYGSRSPIYALPAGFTLRQGRLSSDFFYSGTFDAGGYKIGYIRIPNYAPADQATALRQFDTEIAYFQQNTDGLIVDEMRNTGGFLCFGENIMTRLTPYQFRGIGYELRATWSRVNDFYRNLSAARAQGAEQWVIDLYEAMFNILYRAYTENRGRTGPTSLCSTSIDLQPAAVVYTKPILMLVDEFSTSTADSVPAMFQDAKRGPLFGWRTNGAGGTNVIYDAGAYSEGATGLTLGLMTRAAPISTPEYPASYYIENIGVRPDIEVDYMTRDNLLNAGRPYVTAFTAAMVDLIKKSKP